MFHRKRFPLQTDGDGYSLYSVGPNAKDDGGKKTDNDKEGKGWDDIVVRISKVP